MACFERALNVLARPLRMIKPESQKIGRPEIKPVIPRACALLLSPVFDRTYREMLSIPPVLSRVIPIIAPNTIRSPIEAMVFPNPSRMVFTTSPEGIVKIARKSETRKSETKALILHTDVSKITAMTLTKTKLAVKSMFIDSGTYLDFI
jgi:hypothetical protein